MNGGSVVNFAKEIIARSTNVDEDFDIFKDGAKIHDKDKDAPGLIVMNCGQLYYSHKYNRAMTLRSWSALPRKSISHDSIQLDDVHNLLEGHRDATEHIKWGFQHVIHNKDLVDPNAEVYVIAIENGAEKLLNILKAEFDKYAIRITAIAIINSFMGPSEITSPSLTAFLHQRARHWKVNTDSNNPKECIEVPTIEQDARSLDTSASHSSTSPPPD